MKEKLMKVLENYKNKALERKEKYNLPPRPLDEEEVSVFIQSLSLEGLDREEFYIFERETIDRLLLRLLANEVKRGTFLLHISRLKAWPMWSGAKYLQLI